MRILFAGGGTAGHVSPALAMAEMIKETHSDAQIAFVGRCGGRENKAIESEGYLLYTLDLMGFKRSIHKDNIMAFKKLIRSFRYADKLLSDFSPDLVIGTGGYVCYPILRKSITKKIPTLLHESNAFPGLVTRMLASKCSCVLLGEEKCKEHLNKRAKCIYVGNPIRKDFKKVSRKDARLALNIGNNEIFVLSFGGSGGANAINNAVIEAMLSYTAKESTVRHIHATGKIYYEEIRSSYPELCRNKGRCKLIPYIDNMPLLLNAADITITRSGAMTLAELSATDAIPILVPSPNVAANHQYHNAKVLEEQGAAIIIEEKNLDGDALTNALRELINSPGKRREIIRKKAKASQTSDNDTLIGVIDQYLSHSISASK